MVTAFLIAWRFFRGQAAAGHETAHAAAAPAPVAAVTPAGEA
jgi:hypothetical protein